MKNKTTYEMEDVIGLITRDLADKGLVPDPGSMKIRAVVAETAVFPSDIEIDVNVSWVGIPAQDDDDDPSPPRARARRVSGPDTDIDPPSHDLLDEAPQPGVAPALEIGIDDVTAASAKIARSSGTGPFAPERVKRRLMNDESTDWPGSPPSRRR